MRFKKSNVNVHVVFSFRFFLEACALRRTSPGMCLKENVSRHVPQGERLRHQNVECTPASFQLGGTSDLMSSAATCFSNSSIRIGFCSTSSRPPVTLSVARSS